MKESAPARRSIRQALHEEWETVSPPLRTLAQAMMMTGGLAAVVGVAADAAGVWSRFPFLTNLASSATAALFGMPIALLVLQRVSKLQEEARERVDLQGQARRFAEKLSGGVLSVCGRAMDAPRS